MSFSPRVSTRRLVAATTVVVAGALGVAACGGQVVSGASPRSQLHGAIRSLDSSPALSFDLHLATTAAGLRQLDPTIPQRAASLFAGADLRVTVESANGKPMNQEKSRSLSPARSLELVREAIALDLRGSPVVEVRVVKGVLYIRAAVDQLLHLAGESPEALRRLEAELPKSQETEFVRAFLQDKWVSLDLAALYRSGALPNTTPSAAKRTRFTAALEQALQRDTTVTRAGSAGGTDTLIVTANLATLGRDLVSAFDSEVPAQSLGKLDQTLSKLPNRRAHLHVSIKGGHLTGLSMDLAQFAPASSPLHGKHLVLGMAISRPPHPAITAPSGAVPVNLQLLQRGLAASSSSSSALG